MKDSGEEKEEIQKTAKSPSRNGLPSDIETENASSSSLCFSANTIMLLIVALPLLLILVITSRLYSMDEHILSFHSNIWSGVQGGHSLSDQFAEGNCRSSVSFPSSSPPSPSPASLMSLETRVLSLEASITALKQSIDSLSKEIHVLNSEQRGCSQCSTKHIDSSDEVGNIPNDRHNDDRPYDQFQNDMGMTRNVAYIFQNIDGNLDGILDRAEMISFISKRPDLRGRSSSSTHPEASRNAIEFGLELLNLVDLDGDKIVHLCEWLDALQKEGKPVNMKSMMELATACEIAIPPIEVQIQNIKETSLLENRLRQCLKQR